MRIRSKFTLSFVLLAFTVLGGYALAMDLFLQDAFKHFVQGKQVEIVRQTMTDQAPPVCIEWVKKPARSKLPEECFDYLPIKNSQGFKLLIQRTEFDQNSPEIAFLKAHKQSTLLVAALAVGLSIFLAYLFSRFLLRRIVDLRDSMNEYRETGKVEKIETRKIDDEFDELASDYNHLLEAIQKQEKVRKDFFVDVTHELRTPLTSIQGYLEGLQDGVYQPSQQIYEKMLVELKRLTKMVKEMTNLARTESEILQLEKTVADLESLSQEVVELLATSAKQKGIKLEISGKGSACLDQAKFKQVMINLVNNAIQHGKENSTVKIEIKETKTATEIEVINQADDLEASEMEYWFERFYKTDKSRKYKSETGENHNLGIGLAIVKKIVEAHSGSVRAEKTGDSEVTVKIKLPPAN